MNRLEMETTFGGRVVVVRSTSYWGRYSQAVYDGSPHLESHWCASEEQALDELHRLLASRPARALRRSGGSSPTKLA